TSAIRQNNKRVCKAYEKFRIRKTGQEMVCYQQGSFLGYIATANLIYYEMTREEFEERREWLRKNSFEVTIMPPDPVPSSEPAPAPEPSAASESSPAPDSSPTSAQ
ncbi:MAG TPA: hypothetical protein VLR94_11100, partial [Acidobacteriota bacterium]|nr:hypothetical protein [Acidobacteriota bacterium]